MKEMREKLIKLLWLREQPIKSKKDDHGRVRKEGRKIDESSD